MKKLIQITLFNAFSFAAAIPAFSQDATEAKEEKPKIPCQDTSIRIFCIAFNNPKSGTLMGNPAATEDFQWVVH